MVGDELYFVVQYGGLGAFDLWKTDGTGPGTTPVRTLDPGGNGSSLFVLDLMELNGTAIFRSYDDEHGYELWRSDGTEAGTGLLKDVFPGPSSAQIGDLVDWGTPPLMAGRISEIVPVTPSLIFAQ